MKVVIGYDTREHLAYKVALKSLLDHSSIPLFVEKLELERVRQCGLYVRPHAVQDGILWDVISDAPMSTQFALTRFLVPIMQHGGWALFVDCDVVFMDDVAKIFEQADHTKAVQVVKHGDLPSLADKMDGQPQTAYARKNWSSVVLWNCDHPANQRLTLGAINTLPGRTLHQFFWLHDHEIGELTPDWNWLVNVEPVPDAPKIAHFTLGGPWITGWARQPHDDIWTKHYAPHRVQPASVGH